MVVNKTVKLTPFAITTKREMMCLRSTTSTSLLQLRPQKLQSFSTKASSSSLKMTQTIEHIVLFKVKPNTDSNNINSMLNGLNNLISLPQILHLSAGPILKNRSSSSSFTHMLHSRYPTKQALSDYSAHPDHVGVVKGSVLPICEEIMAVDWVAELDSPVIHPGSAMRLNLLKLKEGLGESEKGEVLKVIGGVKDLFGGSIGQISFGENFSPARAKGFSIASLAVVPGLNELEGLDANEEKVNEQKAKVKEFLDSVIVLDYFVQPPQSASL